MPSLIHLDSLGTSKFSKYWLVIWCSVGWLHSHVLTLMSNVGFFPPPNRLISTIAFKLWSCLYILNFWWYHLFLCIPHFFLHGIFDENNSFFLGIPPWIFLTSLFAQGACAGELSVDVAVSIQARRTSLELMLRCGPRWLDSNSLSIPNVWYICLDWSHKNQPFK